MNIEDILAQEERKAFPPVVLETGHPCTLIVDGIPVIPRAREAKLKTVLEKVFVQYGRIEDFWLPFVDDSKNYGCLFLTYSKPAEAEACFKALNNVRFDKNHVLKITPYKSLDDALDSDAKPPETVNTEEDASLYDWLLHPSADQFALYYNGRIDVNWTGSGNGTPRLEYAFENWSGSFVQWSPLGTFFASLHIRGVALWGGSKFTSYGRFMHEDVSLLSFSPSEKYLMTYVPPTANKKKTLYIWETATGGGSEPIKKFSSPDKNEPFFKWSHNDEYFSRLVEVHTKEKNETKVKHKLEIYTAATFELFKVFVKTPSHSQAAINPDQHIQEHAWSPRDNYIAIYLPENDQIAAKVQIVDVVAGVIVGQVNLFNVVNCKLYWQDHGDYLAVKTGRVKRNKNQTYTSIELFRLREKDVPVESIEISEVVNDEEVAWEPRGGKILAFLHSQSPNATRKTVEFFTMEGKAAKQLWKYENRPANRLFWSPAGRYIVLAGLMSLNGVLEFFDAETGRFLAEDLKHYLASGLTWDPTGRLLATYVSNWTNKNENGYKLWTWYGKEVHSQLKSPFYQFLWRPRPPTLLPAAEAKKLKDPEFFKSFHDRYKKEDQEAVQARLEETRQQKEAIRRKYRERIARRRQELQSPEYKQWLISIGGKAESTDDYVTVTDVKEEIIDTQIVIKDQ